MVQQERGERFFWNNQEVNRHYSIKGGHGERSRHWRGMRSLYSSVGSVPREIAWIIRRSMFRDPQSGR